MMRLPSWRFSGAASSAPTPSSVVSYDEPLRLLLVALLDESEKGQTLLHLTRWKLARMIADQANDWLAEADTDELEREDWV